MAGDAAANELIDVVATLAPAAAVVPPGSPEDDPHRDARAVLGDGPVDWALEVARRTTAEFGDQDVDASDAPVRFIDEARATSLVTLLLQLAGHEATPAAVQTEIIRYRVAHGTPFRHGVSILRRHEHRWLDLLLDAAVQRGAGPEAMRRIVTTLDRYFDRSVDLTVSRYLAEQEHLLNDTAAVRGRMIDVLVAGHAVDAREVRAVLGIDLAGPHLGLVLACDGPDDHLRHVLTGLGTRIGATSVIRRQRSGAAAWLWLTGSRPTEVVDHVLATVGDSRIRIGTGSPHPGPDGFRRTHLEATDAARLGAGTGRLLVHYSDTALVALLSSDLERARWFVTDRLGALAAGDAATAELRDTLAHYFRAGMRQVTAAESLHIHRNTLAYRLAHIAELLGHPVDEKVTEVDCALLLAEQFGDAVLGAAPHR